MAKGRDKRLIAKRNQKLLERFYFWHEEQRVRLDDVLRILSEEEFFISQETIWDILTSASTAEVDSAKSAIVKPAKPRGRGVPKRIKEVFEYAYQLFPG